MEKIRSSTPIVEPLVSKGSGTTSGQPQHEILASRVHCCLLALAALVHEIFDVIFYAWPPGCRLCALSQGVLEHGYELLRYLLYSYLLAGYALDFRLENAEHVSPVQPEKVDISINYIKYSVSGFAFEGGLAFHRFDSCTASPEPLDTLKKQHLTWGYQEFSNPHR
ncbi:hypothetical protein ACTXT7_004968 [Hymenolepis weldensis]